MSWIVCIVVIIAVACIAYHYGEKDGKSSAKIEAQKQSDFFRELTEQRITNETKDRLFREASESATKLYAEKLSTIQSIIENTISSHPDNHYISSVLLDVEETILTRELDDFSYRAPKTVSALEKKFNEKARQWRLESRLYKYQTLFYESLFPDLKEYSTQEGNPEKQEVHSSDWLPEEEYRRLSFEQKQERAQRALDRYVAGSKSKWEVGRDYELYVGHLFRQKGWQVIQYGIAAKLEDLGRDLICRKDGFTLIVQCKFWSQNKEIHEKHIAQLLGTTLSYAVENNLPNVELGHIGGKVATVVPVFVTSTKLSETAMRFAKALHVEVRLIPFDPRTTEFPRIKCNIGKDGKIFHLPFDQMYDRAVISAVGECYASTVREAMSHGFRRAHRWSGSGVPSPN